MTTFFEISSVLFVLREADRDRAEQLAAVSRELGVTNRQALEVVEEASARQFIVSNRQRWELTEAGNALAAAISTGLDDARKRARYRWRPFTTYVPARWATGD